MRVYSEMECDCGCEDSQFCIYFNENTKNCDFPKMCNINKQKKKKHWWQR